MAVSSLKLFATDKELYDLLASSRQRMTERALLNLARDRRIFISHKAEREAIVDYLSCLPHDLQDVEGLIDEAEVGRRGEKTTFVEVAGDVSTEDIKAAIDQYVDEVGASEEITVPPFNMKSLGATIEYNEFDYSRTRLLQRIERKAALDFRIEDGKVTVRLPATEKGQSIVNNLIDKLEKNKKTSLSQNRIAISGFPAEFRTKFFLDLLSGIEGYKTETVTSIKVSSPDIAQEEIDDIGEENEAQDDLENELLGIVRSVALSGENLVSSEQYRQLREKNFYITAITWRSVQQVPPHDLVQFEAAFEQQEQGTGFKYIVRYARTQYARTLSQDLQGRSRHPSPRAFQANRAFGTSVAAKTGRGDIGKERTS
ncbi:hypothetical protein [Brucella anthropi]